jgi:hypothetical protein
MRNRSLIVNVVIVALAVVGGWSTTSAGEAVRDYGTIIGTITGTDNKKVACAIDVPDSFSVRAVAFTERRVFVAASTLVPGSDWRGPVHSALWMFSSRGVGGEPIDFDDREVLVAVTSQMARFGADIPRVVACDDGVAAEVAGFEHSSVRVFDNYGKEYSPSRAALTEACGWAPQVVTPLVWRMPDLATWNLVCAANRFGEWVFLAYDPAKGTATRLFFTEADSKFWQELIMSLARE